MLRQIKLKYFFVGLSLSLSLWGCTADELAIGVPSLELKYFLQPPLLEQDDILLGLKWYLSYLGAPLSIGELENAVRIDTLKQQLSINFAALNFDKQAEYELFKIINTILQSSTYKAQGYIDLGRFVMLTFNSSLHYYKITQAAKQYSDFSNRYNFEDTAMLILNQQTSSVSNGTRVIFKTHLPYHRFSDIAFLAIEGVGDYTHDSFVPLSFEVFDFMDNGQPRFAIYDSFGLLKTAASPLQSSAGKPAKCMWCHESGIQANFVGNGANFNAFNTQIENFNAQIAQLRYALPTDLDYQQLQAHSLAELLYVTFMEPTKERIADEWQLDSAETQAILQQLQPQQNPEFPQMGWVYNRFQIDSLAPFSPITVPENYRDSARYEPEF